MQYAIEHGTRHYVRDHLPLQQGLRPAITIAGVRSMVRDHLPLQQGLRRDKFDVLTTFCISVRDHSPLQQGLRHILYIACNYNTSVRAPRPLP